MSNFDVPAEAGGGTLAAGSATVGDNLMTEAELDRTIDDSFPASDPPAYTPATGIGPPPEPADETISSRGDRRLLLLTSAATLAVAGLSVAFLMRRSRS